MVIPHEQVLELYHYRESLCSQKARAGLAEKGVDYKSHHIMICDLAEECQNLTAEYLAVNPKGIVPTLVHNGEPVYDAHRIIRHVDEHFPNSGSRLWPQDEERAAIAERWFTEAMLDETQPYASTFGMAIPLLSHPILAHTLQRQPLDVVVEKFKHHPIERRGKTFTALRRDGASPPTEAITNALTNLCRGLKEMNGLLERFGGPWLLGDFSLPDVTMMACFHRLEDVHLDDILDNEAIPLIGEYWQRLQARPAYPAAITEMHDEINFRTAVAEVFGEQPSPRLTEAQEIIGQLAA